ncbi:MAG: amidohydrolase family protein [Chloroflexota bacterium]
MGLLLKHANVIDGVAPEPRTDIGVLIEGGWIRALSANLQPERATSVIDCAGRFLLPGLIDCHTHLCFDASAKPVDHLIAESDTTTLLKMVHHARQTLQRGVTTVRDLGAKHLLDIALRDAINAGLVPGPRLFVSGPVITITGGHCHFMGHQVDDVDAIRRAVRQNVQAGVDVIKVMATGGRLTPGSSLNTTQYTTEELSAAVAEATAAGRKVAAHTGGLEGIRRAVAAGVTSIEHGSYVDDATMCVMKEKGIVWIPTNAPAVQIIQNAPSADFSRAYLDAVRETWNARRAATQRGIELGVRFAAGTDAGVPFTEHGGVALEVKLFHELGMPAMHAIWTATRWAAELLGKSDEIGSLKVGKRADLILVSGNPLDDLDRLSDPDIVIQNGAIVHSKIERGVAA